MVWERLARDDPYWAVLTAPDKVGNQWKLDAFFQTGIEDVEASLAVIDQHCPDLAKDRALDFGCGVGRLSQALAKTYQSVVGVDVAAKMLELAARHNRAPEQVSFVHNTRADLSKFPAGSFDLVFSLITLQHIPADLIRSYLPEFVRVLRPGGVIYFQLPTSVPPEPIEARKWSWYPPTMATRLKRWGGRWFRRFTGVGDPMRMNALPVAEVESLLQSAGAHMVAIIDQPVTDDCPSNVYIARRPT